jgi:hypothetical protein
VKENTTVGNLVLVHIASNATNGHLLKGRLEAEGIPVLSKGEGDGPYRLGPLYLWVREEHEVQARLVIAEVEGGGLTLTEGEDPADEEETRTTPETG